MARSTEEVQIIEVGDHVFRFTCSLRHGITDLTEYLSDNEGKPWDQLTDLGSEGFTVKINVLHIAGDRRGIPGILDVLQHIWHYLYANDYVATSFVPDIIFGEGGSLTQASR